MAEDPNEKELNTWGIAGGLRTGFITFILALLIMAVVYLYIDKAAADRRAYDDQAKRYQEMIEYMKPTKDRMNAATDTVIKASTKAIASSEKLDSLSNEFIHQKKN